LGGKTDCEKNSVNAECPSPVTNIFSNAVMNKGDQNIFTKSSTTINLFEAKPPLSDKLTSKMELPPPSMNLLIGLAGTLNDEGDDSDIE
jgi:hypothetical protein